MFLIASELLWLDGMTLRAAIMFKSFLVTSKRILFHEKRACSAYVNTYGRVYMNVNLHVRIGVLNNITIMPITYP